MNLLAYFRSVAATFFRRSQTEDDMEEELRLHSQHRTDDLERSGLNRTEAERRTLIEFGGHVRFKEESREALGGNLIDTSIQDARYSLRLLLRQGWIPRATHPALSSMNSAGTTSMYSAFSRTLAVSFTHRMTTARTALHTSCSIMHIGAPSFRPIAA